MQIAEVHNNNNNKLIEDLSVGSIDFSFNEQMKRRQSINIANRQHRHPCCHGLLLFFINHYPLCESGTIF